MKHLLIILALLISCATTNGQVKRERTTFQTDAQWKPVTDIRADVVMCYGTQVHKGMTFEERVKSWRDRGYITHFMTGIAWGEYQDYFTGKWDGRWHIDEGQVEQNGDSIWHGHLVPYNVPNDNFLTYFKQTQIKRAIDAGIDAIFLEEPEYWARAGYSDAFKKEWKNYYGFDWRPQHLSAENTYLSNKLKYHLYYMALEDCFTYAKAYGQSKGMNVRCYVPTHSLLNYSQWSIVSPEASLASMDCVDGYIAQVWTGTSREPNYFNGKAKERVFETAFLEYGCMESMTAPTKRKVFFLTDPIEDRAKDWDDYKRNYQATFTAKLLYPRNNNYEVMPWPDRIYEGLYRVSANSNERANIPRFYSTQMQVMINTLNHMPLSNNQVSGSQGISVLMANSLMFQRAPKPIEGYDDPQLSNFYGEALPFIKRGVPVNIVHIENTGYPDTWKHTKVLLMSYSNMKPLDSKAHQYIANWVKQGGVLVYSGRDDDSFQRVLEWWNQHGNSYSAPSQHLFELMSMPKNATEGRYTVGKGAVYVIRQDPKEFVLQANGDSKLVDTVKKAYENDAKGGQLQWKNVFTLSRGSYDLVSVIDENVVSNQPYTAKGQFIDLFDPQLPILSSKTVRPGEQAFLYNINRIKNKKQPQVLAGAARVYDEKRTQKSYSFVAKSPKNTTNMMRVLLPKQPKLVEISGEKACHTWDVSSKTLLVQFENDPDGVQVSLKW
ncbi:hypothetical protein ACQRD6_05375 [Prevotella sp. SGI.027]